MIVIIMLVLLFFKSCNRDVKTAYKRIEALTVEIQRLKDTCVTKTDLQIEGLKVEKRMIQSTDRKLLDVNRQSAIDTEIKKLEGK
jgi:hypothetical protein